MRMFIRHPLDIPIEIQTHDMSGQNEHIINNVCEGGLCFSSNNPIALGTIIGITIPLIRPIFETKAKVVWCNEVEGHYEIGVEFIETEDIFRARMIEQVCYIEHYKKEIQEKEGRNLTGKEAALEWISKYANTFYAETEK